MIAYKPIWGHFYKLEEQLLRSQFEIFKITVNVNFKHNLGSKDILNTKFRLQVYFKNRLPISYKNMEFKQNRYKLIIGR